MSTPENTAPPINNPQASPEIPPQNIQTSKVDEVLSSPVTGNEQKTSETLGTIGQILIILMYIIPLSWTIYIVMYKLK